MTTVVSIVLRQNKGIVIIDPVDHNLAELPWWAHSAGYAIRLALKEFGVQSRRGRPQRSS